MCMLLGRFQQTRYGFFHILSIASIFRIQRYQSEVAMEGCDMVHHLQIPVRLG